MEKQFFYHANAHGISGSVRRPFQEVIEVKAPSSLPTIGGFGSSRVENFHYRHMLSFASAHTEVTGSHKAEDDTFNTMSSSTIERLNIMNIVTADRVVARLSSKHHADHSEPDIVPLGTHFDNLRIGGREVKVHLDIDLFCQLPTLEALKSKFEEDEEFRKRYREKHHWTEPAQPHTSKAGKLLAARRAWHREQPAEKLPMSKGILNVSLVDRIEHSCTEFESYANVIVLPQVGKIFLGELLVTCDSKRLTMMRLELGSPIDGDASVGGVESNGTIFP